MGWNAQGNGAFLAFKAHGGAHGQLKNFQKYRDPKP
jgi:hypothetical protein